MDEAQKIKNVLKAKERFLSKDEIKLVDVDNFLAYVDSFGINDDDLKYHLDTIYSVLEHADNFSLQDDLWYLEKDFEYLEEYLKQ